LRKADDFGHEDVDACKQEDNRVNKKRILIETGINFRCFKKGKIDNSSKMYG
jgi:hypothetical protein